MVRIFFVNGEWSWNIPYMTRFSKSKLRDISLYEKHVSDPWCKMLKIWGTLTLNSHWHALFFNEQRSRSPFDLSTAPPPRALPIWDMEYKKGHLLLNLLFDLMSLASSASRSVVQINSFFDQGFVGSKRPSPRTTWAKTDEEEIIVKVKLVELVRNKTVTMMRSVTTVTVSGFNLYVRSKERQVSLSR